ncbi:MAG TPA: cell envelope integrity protein CreD [Burkholderiales bacterium]|nr:cell envelope integrity protein CreD [Burkholderiales bacterium]
MRHPLLTKGALVAAIVLILMIPVGMIRGLVAERQARSNEAIAGIADGWGKRQTLASPYLAIPYEREWTAVKRETIDGRLRETRAEQRELQVLRIPASSVQWTVDATLAEKARGIYKARLYNAHISATGTIEVPSRASMEDSSSRYRWHNPKLVVAIADPLGIRAAPEATFGGKRYAFAPGPGDANTNAGLHAPLEGFSGSGPMTFGFTLELAGSEALALSPRGADTLVTMRADWPHPSFQGRFLPATHDIGANGFTAEWRVSRFAAQGANNEAIAVSFIEPVGLYQMLERASKYGFLFIGLTAAAFMLLELLRRLAIHPIQYTLVGLALAMFFLLLTALSEHIGFGAAYAVATTACVALITAYLLRIGKALALFFGAGLAALYAVLYALLQSENYALLGGTLLLFALLAALMLGTRRVDWYRLNSVPST